MTLVDVVRFVAEAIPVLGLIVVSVMLLCGAWGSLSTDEKQ